MEEKKLLGKALIEIAEDIALRAHIGQVDKAGEPYITHPARVVHFVNKVIDDSRDVLVRLYGEDVLDDDNFRAELYAIAWLHDVIEDSDWKADDLRIRTVPENVIDAVEKLSKVPNEPNIDYYERLKGNDQARIVKLADLSDNSDPNRIALIEDRETRERLQEKYKKAFDVLSYNCDDVDVDEDTTPVVRIVSSD